MLNFQKLVKKPPEEDAFKDNALTSEKKFQKLISSMLCTQ
jgi:hypothetical protein